MAEPNGMAFPHGKLPPMHFNGLHSNSSSRGASPVSRAGLIPSSQLPPSRTSIPQSQLPPMRSTTGGLTHKVDQLSISGQNTPNISPSRFSASTPNQEGLHKPTFSENSSPIVPTNHLDNVPLKDNALDNENKNVNPSAVTSLGQTSQYFSQSSSQSSTFESQLNGPTITPSVSQTISQPHLQQTTTTSQTNNSTQHYFQSQNVGQEALFNIQQSAPPPQIRNVPQQPYGVATQQNVVQSTPQPMQTVSNSNIASSSSNWPQQSVVGRNTPQNLFGQGQPPFSVGITASSSVQQAQSVMSQQVRPPQPPNSVQNGPQSTPMQQPPKIGQTLPTQNPPTNFPFNSNQNIQPQNPLTNLPFSSNQNVQPKNLPFNSNNSSQNPPTIPPFSSNQNMHPQNPPISSYQNISAQQRPPNPTTVPPNVAQLPPQVQKPPLNQRPRYPQTLPPGPPQTSQFNSGLPQRVSPYNNQGPPPAPSQRFNPQINYNVGPSVQNQPGQVNYGANGPQSLPPMINNRYPTAPNGPSQIPPGGVVKTGFNRLWGADHYNLLETPEILPPTKLETPKVHLGQEQLNQANCSTEVFRCTVTKIPESASLLQKSRLPLGLLIHPFKDLSYLPVIQCNVIVRCRSCRTYINPFVYFVDSKRWKCNLCFRVNELPEEFQYDPVSKTYGDPSRRPEIKSSTIEYIAPAEYMLRPPQPAVYMFLLDVSRLAVDSGYLEILCAVLLEELKNLPGDARTQIGFLAYDSALHFFSLAEGLNQPHEMTVLDVDDVFLPTPDNLLVNLKDRMEMVEDLLKLLPSRFSNSYDDCSALGAALQVAHKMMGPTGGRVSVFQSALPNTGPGAVTSREDPNQRSTAETAMLNPINDFYKRLALECSGQQIAVDLFVLNSQYVDMATISGISRFSGGSVHQFPLFKSTRPLLVDQFQKDLRRYLTRKIGFEAVMRVRCTRGMAIHTFHGNFFVRSTDLLSLPNINPDAAFGMQVAIEENLTDSQSVCFQAALLYTSSKGERRIRVHTLCLPIANTLHDVIHSADQQCIIGLLGKMAVDRSTQSSLSDAREAFINAAVDVLTSYKFSLNMGSATSGLLAPESLKLLPLYIAAILKHPAFRIGTPTRLDDRVKAMIDMKTLPLPLLIQQIYPDLYPIHNLEDQSVILNSEEEDVPLPPRLHLSSRSLSNKGAFLLDSGDHMMILVGPNVSREFLTDGLGVPDYQSIGDSMIEIPVLENPTNKRLNLFINYLNEEKPYGLSLQVIRDNSPHRGLFIGRLIEDRMENSLSYYEFLQHLKTQVK
ncbi:protein transport protein Sec24A [Anthonomus grandis grandis]|uniref:protein transport protein Sec24A n=1 Tax=Anthonomus grandis grandis TaxID=2921223 RepID=UPI002165D32B|nr:protein transport protein Sec24A [Anthonomus grandis grandis]